MRTSCVFLLACFALIWGSCTPAGDTKIVKNSPSGLRDINNVLHDHSAELMELPGVVGVAVSELDDHTPCIWVMVREQTVDLEKKIPKSLEGHPVVIHIAGTIRPVRPQNK